MTMLVSFSPFSLYRLCVSVLSYHTFLVLPQLVVSFVAGSPSTFHRWHCKLQELAPTSRCVSELSGIPRRVLPFATIASLKGWLLACLYRQMEVLGTSSFTQVGPNWVCLF